MSGFVLKYVSFVGAWMKDKKGTIALTAVLVIIFTLSASVFAGVNSSNSSPSIEQMAQLPQNVIHASQAAGANQTPAWEFVGSHMNYSTHSTISGTVLSGYEHFIITEVDAAANSFNFTENVLNGGFFGNANFSASNLTSFTGRSYIFGANLSELSFFNRATLPNYTTSLIGSSSSYSVTSNYLLATPLGSFLTDNVTVSTLPVETPKEIPVQNFDISYYFDMYSGALLKYTLQNATLNVVETLQSSNIPLSSDSSPFYLNVTPSGAKVSVNGIPTELSSGIANLSLTQGTYFVSVTMQGYLPGFYEVNITAGEISYLNVSLKESSLNTYTISGFITPWDSSVIVGRSIAVVESSGFYSVTVPEGNYTVYASSSGYFPVIGNISLNSNVSNENFSLQKLLAPVDIVTVDNGTATGYGADVVNMSLNNGIAYINYTSNKNGAITVSLPYSYVNDISISDLISSRVYINGTPYSNFSISITAQGGAYSIILTVHNLSGDPTLEWLFSPSASLPQSGLQSPVNDNVLYMGIAAVVVVAIAASSFLFMRRKR